MYLVKETSGFAAPYLLLSVSVASAQSLYTQRCPLLGLSYPALSSYASSDIIQTAMNTLDQSVVQALNQSTAYGQFDSQTNAFLIDFYSLHDSESLFTYSHTGEELIAQHTVGVQMADANSVWRIASISKLLTVYAYLISVGDANWNQPVTDFVPELAAYAAANADQLQNDTIDIVDWRSITIGALASQLSGIAREDIFSAQFEQTLQKLFSLPPSTRNASAICTQDGISGPCDRAAFFADYLRQHPITSPFKTPIYSNIAYEILGYAIANMTGMTMEDVFNDAIVQRLGLNSTSYTVPSSPNASFVPLNVSASLWDYDARGETPTGGYFTSLNDLRKIGRSILNSTLLTPAQTRRWMKPQTFTANVNFSVGAPWEIHRAPLDPVMWLYTKTGDFGAYSSIVALLPEFNVGLTVLGAGYDPSNTVRILSDMTVDIAVPAVYAAARAAAVSAYAGTYSDSASNARITISAPNSGPGLSVSEWTLNGTDVLSAFAALNGVNQTVANLTISLYPSGLTRNSGATMSWRAITQAIPALLDPGVFSTNCVSWGAANGLSYNGVGLDEFLFTLGGNGRATSIEVRVTGVELMSANGTVMPRFLQRLR